jgi:hypothetical protein
MNEHAKMLCFMAGTGIKIHNSVREKCPVQRRDCEGEQFDVEVAVEVCLGLRRTLTPQPRHLI